MTRYLVIVLGVMMIAACASTRPQRQAASDQPTESTMETESALRKVVGAVSGQEIDRDELRRLGREIQNDEEARSAVETISQTISGAVLIKYCPVDGQRYGPEMELCPVHQVPLEILSE